MPVFRKREKWWIGYRTSCGKWRREPVGASYSLAKQVLAKRQAEAVEGIHFPERSANLLPFAKISEEYWTLHGQYLKSKSWQSMLKQINVRFGHMKLKQINTADIQRFYNETAQRTSKSTANRHLTLIKSIFNKAKTWGHFFGENPCDTVKKHREPVSRLRYLTIAEMKRLLSVSHTRLCPVLACALMTGMRKGEILNLSWENINLAQNVIYILESKSGKPREIPIAAPLKDVLLDLEPKPVGKVFELPEITLRRFFAKALEATQITNFRFHDLRHTFASHFIMRTNNLPVLQAILGHSSPNMTLRYAHLSKSHLAQNMAMFASTIPHIEMIEKSKSPYTPNMPIALPTLHRT